MTILVTGASGFLGSAVARLLLAKGEAVRLLVRPNSDRRNVEGLNAELVEGDLNDLDSLKSAVKGIDGLYHVAADYRLFVRNHQEMITTNVEGSCNLIRVAAEAGCARMVYTSSVAAIKPYDDGRIANETTPTTESDMVGIYKLSKFLAHKAVLDLVRQQNINLVVVSPSTPIGPRDVKPTPTGRIVVEAASGRMPAFVDTGLNIAHVDDVAAGHLLAFEKGQAGENYILGGDDLTLGQILTEIADIVGRKPPKVKLPQGLILPFAWVAEKMAYAGWVDEPFATVDGVQMSRKKMFFSSAKAEAQLGYVHRPARKALEDAVAWYRNHGYIG